MKSRQQQWVEPASSTTSPNIRIMQLDVMRGFAVLGIYWVNILVFALPTGSFYMPIPGPGFETSYFLHWSFTEIFIEGTMRGLFSILFGASAMVFLDEAKLAHQGLEVVDRYYRRTLLLILFGLIHGYLLLWPYDVLYAYGILGLLLFPLRKTPVKFLLLGGLVLLLATHLDISAITNKLQSANGTTISAIDSGEQDENPALSRDEIKEIIEEGTEAAHYRSSYLHIFNYQYPSVIDQHSILFYTGHFFDIGGMMLIGMALLKLGILSGQRSRRFYLKLCVLGYLSGLILRSIAIYLQLKFDFDLMENEAPNGVDYDLGRLPVTLGHIGLIGLLCHTVTMQFITDKLANVGRLALTNYIMQTILSIFLFYGFGFSLYAKLTALQLILVCVAVWIVQITFSSYWLKYFKLGPLEWLWRSLIYGKKQALRIT